MDVHTTKIDKSQIKTPDITFTESAIRELKLIVENDFTLSGKYFRLVISGKGCEGFTYSAGFTDINEEDFLVKIKSENTNAGAVKEEYFVAVDPFAAFYLNHVTVDFILDVKNDEEGFVVKNHLQREYFGKFWKQYPEKTPPLTTESRS